MRRMLARIAAVAVLAGGLFLGLGSHAGAGEICVGARLIDPLDDFKICLKTP